MVLRPAGRILIVNQNWMGDVLFSTPAIRALRKNFPQSFIACLAPERVAEVLRHNPHLNEVLTYDERAGIFSVAKIIQVWAMIRRRRFDTVFFFHGSRSKVFLTMLAGIPERIGFSLEGRKRFLTKAVPWPVESLHKTDLFLYLIRFVGVKPDGRESDLEVTAEEKGSLEKKLMQEGVAPNESYAVVHAGGNWTLKRWPVEYFIRWIRSFLSQSSWKIVLCGTSAEGDLACRILESFPGQRVVSLCGKTSLGELAALLGRAKFLISNDSGPIHVAASQRSRILGLYGPTSEKLTGPIVSTNSKILRKDVGCEVPCYFRQCDHRVCLDLLSPEEVFVHTQEFFA